MAAVRFKDIFTPGFFINYVVTLALTSWIRLVPLKFVTDDGVVLREYTPRIFELYRDVIYAPAKPVIYVILLSHLLGVFVISASIWYLVLRRGTASRDPQQQ